MIKHSKSQSGSEGTWRYQNESLLFEGGNRGQRPKRTERQKVQGPPRANQGKRGQGRMPANASHPGLERVGRGAEGLETVGQPVRWKMKER